MQPRLPGGTATTGERNPLGTDDDALVGAALEAQLNSRETQRELGNGTTRGWGPGEVDDGSAYSVGIPQFETTYEVRAWGTDEGEVRDVVNRVIEAASGIVDELQTRAGAPEAVRYEPFVLAPTQVDELPPTAGTKLVIAVMGVGVLVGAAWSIVADRLLRRRTTRSPQDPPSAGAAGPPEPDGPPAERTRQEPVRGPAEAVTGERPGTSGKGSRPARGSHRPRPSKPSSSSTSGPPSGPAPGRTTDGASLTRR